jgi:hypothetical protein
MKTGLQAVHDAYRTLQIVTLSEGAKRQDLMVSMVETKSPCPFVIINFQLTSDTVRYRASGLSGSACPSAYVAAKAFSPRAARMLAMLSVYAASPFSPALRY